MPVNTSVTQHCYVNKVAPESSMSKDIQGLPHLSCVVFVSRILGRLNTKRLNTPWVITSTFLTIPRALQGGESLGNAVCFSS